VKATRDPSPRLAKCVVPLPSPAGRVGSQGSASMCPRSGRARHKHHSSVSSTARKSPSGCSFNPNKPRSSSRVTGQVWGEGGRRLRGALGPGARDKHKPKSALAFLGEVFFISPAARSKRAVHHRSSGLLTINRRAAASRPREPLHCARKHAAHSIHCTHCTHGGVCNHEPRARRACTSRVSPPPRKHRSEACAGVVSARAWSVRRVRRPLIEKLSR
jgi:hypothetical protein